MQRAPAAAGAAITEHVLQTDRHTTHYLAAGPKSGPLIIFCHGWADLGISWRHVLPVMSMLGFRAVAPDLRGCGRSTAHGTREAYAQREFVQDMLELLGALKQPRAIWVGHDYGAIIAWNIASHHPEACAGVVGLGVPYWSLERGVDHVISKVSRDVYPEKDYPAGQWEHVRFWEENFEKATKQMEMRVPQLFKLMMRHGTRVPVGRVSPLAKTRKQGGWFGGEMKAPIDVALDKHVLDETSLNAYSAAYGKTGFFGANSWHMNHKVNAKYAEEALEDGFLRMPVLYIAAEYDDVWTRELEDEMPAHCSDLSTASIPCGHWMAQEKPSALNSVLLDWLARKVTSHWPAASMGGRSRGKRA